MKSKLLTVEIIRHVMDVHEKEHTKLVNALDTALHDVAKEGKVDGREQSDIEYQIEELMTSLVEAAIIDTLDKVNHYTEYLDDDELIESGAIDEYHDICQFVFKKSDKIRAFLHLKRDL